MLLFLSLPLASVSAQSATLCEVKRDYSDCSHGEAPREYRIYQENGVWKTDIRCYLSINSKVKNGEIDNPLVDTLISDSDAEDNDCK